MPESIIKLTNDNEEIGPKDPTEEEDRTNGGTNNGETEAEEQEKEKQEQETVDKRNKNNKPEKEKVAHLITRYEVSLALRSYGNDLVGATMEKSV